MPIPEFFCHEFCDQHDFNYWIGGDEKDREKADHQFLVAMLEAAGSNPIKQQIAFSYWMAVRLFGAMCFNYTSRERDETDLAKALAGDREALKPHSPVWGFDHTWLRTIEQ